MVGEDGVLPLPWVGPWLDAARRLARGIAAAPAVEAVAAEVRAALRG